MIDRYLIREVRSLVNVIVLFPKTEVARSIRNLLVRSGFEVTAVCATGAQVVQRMEGVEEGLVVCGYKCSDMIYSELREYLSGEIKMLLIASRQYLDDCVYPNVTGLPMPLKGHELVEKTREIVTEISEKQRRRKQRPKQRTREEIRLGRQSIFPSRTRTCAAFYIVQRKFQKAPAPLNQAYTPRRGKRGRSSYLQGCGTFSPAYLSEYPEAFRWCGYRFLPAY